MITSMIFVLMLALTITCIFFVDQPVSAWFAANQDYRYGAQLTTDFALGEYWFGLALFAYVLGKWIFPLWKSNYLHHHQRAQLLKWQGLQLFWALTTAGLILRILKFLIGRQRPHKSPVWDPLVFEPFNMHWHFQSMPSGHAQVLFTVAFLFSFFWPRGKWAFFFLAALFSLTRVILHQHFLSDVMAGALVGILGSKLSLFYFTKKFPIPQSTSD
jgi:membrane-associated phospholipid phosphatase